MLLSNHFFQNYNWKYLCRKLVLENGLTVGLNPRLTSKKITKYILGTRDTVEVFKLYELRYLLLKIYPLIHVLFSNPRVNSRFEFKLSKVESLQPKSFKDQTFISQKKNFPKKRISFSFKHKNLPPQILFATTTEAFSDVIFKAANICNMPYHRNRWISGSVTAAISDLDDNDAWHYIQNLSQKKISYFFNKRWSTNKENSEKTKEKNKFYGHSRWPSLVVIPDISNNNMILSEVKKIGIPVIGLVNSHCPFEIDYPIFAQDQTFSSVYFFCHFFATLIAKEMAYLQHKYYILQKKPFQEKKKTTQIKRPKKKDLSFKKIVTRQKINRNWQDAFLFKGIVASQQKIIKQHWLSRQIPKVWKKQSKKKLFFLDPICWKNSCVKLVQKKQNSKNWAKKNPGIPSLFSWTNFFKKFYSYSKKFNKYDRDFLLLRFLLLYSKNLWQTLNSHWEKRRIFPATIFFKKEKKKKYFLTKKIFFSEFEKNRLQLNLFPHFLWILKKAKFFWAYRMFALEQTWHTNSKYYWWSLHNLFSDLKWQNSKHLLPKFPRFKGINDTYQNNDYLWQKKYHKKRYKQTRTTFAWKVWLNKNRRKAHRNQPWKKQPFSKSRNKSRKPKNKTNKSRNKT